MTVQQYPMTVRELSFGRYKVHSQTEPEVEYLVKFIASDNSYTCDCGDSIYRGNVCKHIKQIPRCTSRYAKYLVALTCDLPKGHLGQHHGTYAPKRNAIEVLRW